VSTTVRPPVTIFLPLSHYHEGFLRQAIDSVFAQTRPEWRLLIVITGSGLAHFRTLLEEPLRDPRVRLIPNQGRLLAGSYNTAMRKLETEFIGALLGDDLWALNAVEVLGDCIQANPGVDFFHSGRYFIDAEGRRISSDYLPKRPVTAEAFVAGSPVKHLLCWRAVKGLEYGGVDESLNNFGSDDYDFPWTMLERGAVFQAIPECLYIVRDHREGYRMTTHVPRSAQLRELRRILEKHGVTPALVREQLRDARRGYLKQSLFRNPLTRWLKERLGFDARRGWRQPYR
jgi:hypothetical protein